MKRELRACFAAVAAVALLIGAAGCAGTPANSPPAASDQSPFSMKVEAVDGDEAPQGLQDWAMTQQDQQAAAYLAATEGEHTYFAVTGGLKSSGGYDLVLKRVESQGKDLLVEVSVQAPAPGSVVTGALTNPTRFWKLEKPVEGEVKVTILQ